MATKNVELLSADANQDILHPKTNTDMVEVTANQNLTQKLNTLLPLAGGTMTGQLAMNGNAIRLGGASENPRIGYDSNTQDVYISNANNNWFRIKADRTMTIGGRKVYTEIEPPTAQEVGALPLTGGTLTGDLTVQGIIEAKQRITTNELFYAKNPTTGDGAIVAKIANHGGVDIGDSTKQLALCSVDQPLYYDGIGTTRYRIWNEKNNPININPIADTLVQRNADGDILAKKLLIDDGEIWNGVDKTIGIGIAHYSNSNDSYLRRLANSNMDLGHSNYRWRNIYATNGTIQTSDERYKADIQDIDDEQFFDMVKGVSVNTYVMLDERKDLMTLELLEDEENKQETAKSERVQCGIIAQEMAQFDCGKYILVYDEETDVYSVNNYNFTSAVMGALKVEIKKREELESKCSKLEERLSALEELVLNKVA